MNFFLSTCGTSILTYNTEPNLRNTLNRNANANQLDDIPADDREAIEVHVEGVKKDIHNMSISDAGKCSAELNGILAYYNGQLSSLKRDQHFLLATDTYLGEETANAIKRWLEANGAQSVYVKRLPDLQTSDLTSFQSSLSDLVKLCVEEINPRRTPGTSVIFNLSGGFKPVAGFLQALGMFYADETIYIFERSSKLMRIPRLPVEMQDEQSVRDDIGDMRRGALGLTVQISTDKKNSLYWTPIDDGLMLTPWGTLIFEQHKTKIYGSRILPPISDKVAYGPQFESSCAQEASNRLCDINDKIDKLSIYAECSKNLSSLDFKPIKGGSLPSGATHECDAWHDGKAKRLFCRRGDGGLITVIELAEALH